MTTVVLVFGTLVTAIGVFGVVMPTRLLRLASARFRRGMLPATFAARLVVGIMLVAAASDTVFPSILRLVGYVLVATAMAIPLVGVRRIEAFRLRVVTGCPSALIRAGAAATIGLGSFLVYAVL